MEFIFWFYGCHSSLCLWVIFFNQNPSPQQFYSDLFAFQLAFIFKSTFLQNFIPMIFYWNLKFSKRCHHLVLEEIYTCLHTLHIIKNGWISISNHYWCFALEAMNNSWTQVNLWLFSLQSLPFPIVYNYKKRTTYIKSTLAGLQVRHVQHLLAPVSIHIGL